MTLVALSACTTAPPQPLPPQAQTTAPVIHTSASNRCTNLLDDYETSSLMDDKGRKQILDSVSDTWMLTKDSCEQLRLALLLSQPGRSNKDRKQALKLLKELLSGEKPLDGQAHQLARLLHDQLQQFRSQQLRTLELRHRLKAQHTASQQLAEKLGNLQSQLQQLKNIEQDINEKEQSIIAPSTGNISHEPP